jgi:hypothetical protein
MRKLARGRRFHPHRTVRSSHIRQKAMFIFLTLCLLINLLCVPTPVGDHYKDYNKLLELLPKGSSQARDVERALRAVKPRLEAAQKQEVDEMVGKLKGIGNSILGT